MFINALTVIISISAGVVENMKLSKTTVIYWLVNAVLVLTLVYGLHMRGAL